MYIQLPHTKGPILLEHHGGATAIAPQWCLELPSDKHQNKHKMNVKDLTAFYDTYDAI